MKEAFVSFELAKLLKEKGFNSPCHAIWYDNRIVLLAHLIDNDSLLLIDEYKFSIQKESLITIPTHQMACAWLREIYDLHIIAYPFKSGNDTSTKHYCCQVFKTFNLLGHEKYTNETLTSYEEAVETAIKYCLEKLIK